MQDFSLFVSFHVCNFIFKLVKFTCYYRSKILRIFFGPGHNWAPAGTTGQEGPEDTRGNGKKQQALGIPTWQWAPFDSGHHWAYLLGNEHPYWALSSCGHQRAPPGNNGQQTTVGIIRHWTSLSGTTRH